MYIRRYDFIFEIETEGRFICPACIEIVFQIFNLLTDKLNYIEIINSFFDLDLYINLNLFTLEY